MDWWLHLLPARMQAVWFGLTLLALLLLCLFGTARLVYEGEWLMAFVPAAGVVFLAFVLRTLLTLIARDLESAVHPGPDEERGPIE
ncbi:MAG: hypothetical protein HZA61_04515 [Candidatus Eisenbacteria bacterium]|uniref:Uncharacterized protein n=1 Tax=Eiseniibacteriota bacterium TaxID=2212470 RepID=A0A933W9V4_UNCEI|nr:hypothetical protein [Candidatus Eisenbacteria bacterium]